MLLSTIASNDEYDVDIRCYIHDQDDPAAAVAAEYTILSKVLQAHRAVLSAWSSVFQKMLNSVLNESKPGIIEIKDVDYEVIKELLYFMYTNELSGDIGAILGEYVEPLLYTANKYNITGLVTLCDQYLVGQISDRTAVMLYQKAQKYDLYLVNKAALSHMKLSAKFIMKSYVDRAVD